MIKIQFFDAFLYSFFCGDKEASVDKKWCEQPITFQTFCDKNELLFLQNRLPIETAIFLKQVHKNRGLVVDEMNKNSESFSVNGDYLVTNLSAIGLGILTADCLPVICIDIKNKAIGIAHAGWRGSIEGVVSEMIKKMQEVYGTFLSDVKIIFGPSAKKCCYEVGDDCITMIKENIFEDLSDILEQREGKIFFDLPLLNEKQLSILEGFDSSVVDHHYNVCTICTPRYCSYRRDRNQRRNVTIVALW